MNTKMRSMVAAGLLLATLNLSVVSSYAAQTSSGATPSAKITSATPRVVTTRNSLSAQELALYQQKASAAQQAANSKAAGAADNKTVWIVVGVVAVVGVIAIASSGGGGGGGGY